MESLEGNDTIIGLGNDLLLEGNLSYIDTANDIDLTRIARLNNQAELEANNIIIF